MSATTAPPPPPPPPAAYGPAGRPFHRPLGVAIVAIIIMFVGVLVVIAGMAIMFIGGVGGAFLAGPVGAAVGAFVGLVVLIVGLITLAAGTGLWRMRSWAWWLAMIILVLQFIGSLATVVGAVVYGLLILYLVLVRKHFNQ